MTLNLPIILGSSSPRRLQLLQEAGYAPIVSMPRIDDSVFGIGSMHPTQWVETLAKLKAMDVQRTFEGIGTVLTADTVCVVDTTVFGQPTSAAEAEMMIRAVQDRSHEVYSGWCLFCMSGLQLDSGWEAATITMGKLNEAQIQSYIQSGEWQGKAGGYNVSQRLEANWPIEVAGDMTTVMGLPMKRLQSVLDSMVCKQ